MTDTDDSKLTRIRRVVRHYHYALDINKDVDEAARNALERIQDIIGEPWLPGAALERRRRRFSWEPDDLVIVTPEES